MRQQLQKLIILFSAVLLTACGIKEGKVLDTYGNPISNIHILFGTKDGTILTAISDEKGVFQYPETASPLHSLTVDAPGYQQITAIAGTRTQFILDIDDSMDSDGDYLSDNEEGTLGTDARNPDTDGDGLPDSIESRIIYPIALVPMGVSPLHKDLLIEIDWDQNLPSTEITDLAVNIAKSTFRNAPVNNPDKTTGIHLIVDRGEFGGGSGEIRNLADNRAGIFYYTATNLTSDELFGYAIINGRENKLNGNFGKFGLAEGFVEAIVWLHELGHNLGLDHGGNDGVHCKPNYVSVMNYNPFMALSFSYSRGNLPELDESALDEKNGIGFGSVDWNSNSQIDQALVQSNIDGYTPVNLIQTLLNTIDISALPPDLARALNPERCESNSISDIHHDHNDWAVISARLDNDLLQILPLLAISADSKPTSTTLSSPQLKTETVDLFNFPDEIVTLLDQLDFEPNQPAL